MSRAVNNPKRKKGRVGGGGGKVEVFMIPRSFTTMSVNFYTTQQTINQSKILAFFFRVSVNKGAKKKGFVFYWTTKKYSTTLKLRW